MFQKIGGSSMAKFEWIFTGMKGSKSSKKAIEAFAKADETACNLHLDPPVAEDTAAGAYSRSQIVGP
jgi:hypothetical protein